MFQPPSPARALPGALFVTAFALMCGMAAYLSLRTQAARSSVWQEAQVQVARSLAAQIGRAQAEDNDLAALTALGEARSLHPQLKAAMVFDAAGRVTLHTDPGQLGRTVPVPVGVRLSTPETGPWQEGGRRLFAVLTPLPNQEESYLRALFDGSDQVRGTGTLWVHVLLLAFGASALLALGARAWLSRYEWLDPRARAAALDAPPSPEPSRRVAGLLLAEMPHAALTLDRDQVILAANTLALDLLNCRQEELVGLHVLKAPLPSELLALYQEALPFPGQPLERRLKLTERSPALTLTVTFTPASDQWELALITLR